MENAEVKSDIIESLINVLQALRSDYVVNCVRGVFISGVKGMPPAVLDYLDACTIEGKSKSTIKHKRLMLELFFGAVQLPVERITTNDVRRYLASYKAERGISDRTLDGMRITFNALFKWLTVNEYIPKNPVEKIAPIRYEKKERKALKRIEFEQLRNACDNKTDLAMVDFMFSTGCRVSEVVHAKLSDINWQNHSVKVINGKGKKDRTVYMSDRCVLSLKDYIDNIRKGDSEYIFVSKCRPYNALTIGCIEKRLRLIVKRCGEISTPVSPHIMRHTFGTLGYQGGMKLEELQVVMGHESIDTTRIYAEINSDDVRVAHAKAVI